MKAVLVKRRRGHRLALCNYAIRHVGEPIEDPDQLAHHLKLLVKEVGGSKHAAVAVSDPDAVIKIVEQPPTPKDLMRKALKVSGQRILNQECQGYILDCDVLQGAKPPQEEKDGEAEAKPTPGPQNEKVKFLVAGLPRTRVDLIHAGLGKAKLYPGALQVGPLCIFNAFEAAEPQTVREESFLLVDIGHTESTLLMGKAGELVLVRSFGSGADQLFESLTADGAIDRESAITLLEGGDAGIGDAVAPGLEAIAREIKASIGFFEGQFEGNISCVHLSGGAVRSEMLLQQLSDQLELSCELWDPFSNCEVSLPKAKVEGFKTDFVNLDIAFGAALEVLQPDS